MLNAPTRPATTSIDLRADDCPDPYVRAVTGLGMRQTAPVIDAAEEGLPISSCTRTE